MSDLDRSFQRLIDANPAPIVVIEDRPPAGVFLDDLAKAPSDPVTSVRPRARYLVAAAAFLATIALGVGLLLGRLFVESEPTDTSTTTTTTTAVTTTSAVPETSTTLAAESIDPQLQEWLDRFVTTYNAGDADAVMALLAPDLVREVIVDSDRRLYVRELIRGIYEVEVVLNTVLRLECTQEGSLLTCDTVRYDDLHRILGIPETETWGWNLRFDDEGLIRSWNEGRPNVRDADDYEREASGPFVRWVFQNHPEVGEINPATASDWIPEKIDVIEAMVDAWAEELGVTLEE